MKRFKKGAASFYIVSFSTLILVIVAASFATVIISAITRASNDDLSQSAYDAALAGVEDAKLAFANYQRCLQKTGITPREPDGDGMVTCEEILWWMQPENADCDMVAHMIGRIPDYESGEVMVSDTTSTDGSGKTSDLNQAYTCVKIGTVLKDYRANLSSTTNYRLVRVSLDDVAAKDIKKIRFSWYSVREGQTTSFSNFSDNRVTFKPVTETVQPPTPPTIELQMVQTSDNFTMDEVNSPSENIGGTWYTDRATLFLVPVDPNETTLSSGRDGNYISVYDEENEVNVISPAQVAKTNYQHINIMPYAVKCSTTGAFLCETTIELPEPFKGARADGTFLFLVTLPYGEPDTDFAMMFLCDDDVVCSTETSDDEEVIGSSTAYISEVQIVIDSTGRANDLFRRVETRLESMDVSFPFVYYALQILDTGMGNAMPITKELVVTSEYNRTSYDM